MLGESDYLAAPATLESFLERYRAATEPLAHAAASEPARPRHVVTSEPAHASIAGRNPSARRLSASRRSQPPMGQPAPSRPAVRPVIIHDPDLATELSPIAMPDRVQRVCAPDVIGSRASGAPRPADGGEQPAEPAPLHNAGARGRGGTRGFLRACGDPRACGYARTGGHHADAVPFLSSPTLESSRSRSSADDAPLDYSAPLDVSPVEEHAKAPTVGSAGALRPLPWLCWRSLAPACPRRAASSRRCRRNNDGTLIMNSNPPGAKLFVDGVERGVTPLTVALKTGAAFAGVARRRPAAADADHHDRRRAGLAVHRAAEDRVDVRAAAGAHRTGRRACQRRRRRARHLTGHGRRSDAGRARRAPRERSGLGQADRHHRSRYHRIADGAARRRPTARRCRAGLRSPRPPTCRCSRTSD